MPKWHGRYLFNVFSLSHCANCTACTAVWPEGPPRSRAGLGGAAVNTGTMCGNSQGSCRQHRRNEIPKNLQKTIRALLAKGSRSDKNYSCFTQSLSRSLLPVSNIGGCLCQLPLFLSKHLVELPTHHPGLEFSVASFKPLVQFLS